jgi:hypothetical protein
MARTPWVFVVDEAGLIVAHGPGRIDRTADMAAGRLRLADRRLSPGPELARFLDHRGEEAFSLRKWMALPPRDVCDGGAVLWCPFALLLLAILRIELREAGINMTVGRAVTRRRELEESLMAYTAGAVDRVLNDLDDTQARLTAGPNRPHSRRTYKSIPLDTDGSGGHLHNTALPPRPACRCSTLRCSALPPRHCTSGCNRRSWHRR